LHDVLPASGVVLLLQPKVPGVFFYQCQIGAWVLALIANANLLKHFEKE
jgi:hypothetical protein